MKKALSFFLAVVMLLTCGMTAAFADGYKAGTYEGVGNGNNGEVKVCLVRVFRT